MDIQLEQARDLILKYCEEYDHHKAKIDTTAANTAELIDALNAKDSAASSTPDTADTAAPPSPDTAPDTRSKKKKKKIESKGQGCIRNIKR